MFDHLRKLLRDGNAAPPESAEQRRRMAAAVLLLEVARADYQRQPAEQAALRTALREFGVAEAEVETLLAAAEVKAEQSVSMFNFVRTLNRTMSPDDKRRLLGLLWDVAQADGHVDPQEEHLLRRIADLLHLSHADFIRGKLASER